MDDNNRLRFMLQTAVQALHWTYCLFWKFSLQQRELVWSDGYYNGAIKMRKTVQRGGADEAAPQRSKQLKELYEALSCGVQQRSTAALSPEDLTDSEWFYLMCVSFTFSPGIGLPGKAYVERQYIWMENADEADCAIFSRAILAKSARIQTVVCIPVLDGVVELGVTKLVKENIGLIQQVKSFFIDNKNSNTNLALSGHSTSNPPSSSGKGFHSSASYVHSENGLHENAISIIRKVIQFDISEDIMIESSDNSFNNAVSRPKNLSEYPQLLQNRTTSSIQPSRLQGNGTNYSQTVSDILQNQSNLRSRNLSCSTTSPFSRWSYTANHLLHRPSQWALKYILFTVPHLIQRGSTSHEDLSSSHVMVERRRREKLNKRFSILRSLVPFVTKMDKASVLGDTIEYLKQLQKKIRELETRIRNLEAENSVHLGEQRSEPLVKRNTRIVNGAKAAVKVEVSIIENDALVDIQCLHKEGLLMDVMQVVEKLGIQVMTAQSSISDGFFAAELRAKVKENEYGRKPTIMEVKRAIINRTIL